MGSQRILASSGSQLEIATKEQKAAAMGKLKIVGEYFEFLGHQKKWWMFPIAFVVLLFGLLILFTQSSPIAPFIYTLF